MTRNSPRLALLAIIVALFWVATADRVWAGEFTAQTTVERLGKMKKATLFVKGKRLRVETVDPYGQEQVLVYDPSRKMTVLVYPKNREYMRLPAVAAMSPVGSDEAALKKIGKRTLLGRESLKGYSCAKYEVAFHNKYRGKMIVWVADKLDFPVMMIHKGGPENGRKWELTDINEGGLADDLFEIPKDYRLTKKPFQGFCGAGVCDFSIF